MLLGLGRLDSVQAPCLKSRQIYVLYHYFIIFFIIIFFYILLYYFFPSSAQVKPETAHVEFLAPSIQMFPAGCVTLFTIFFLKKAKASIEFQKLTV